MVNEFSEDRIEESKMSSSLKDNLKPNDVQEVDDIKLSGNSDNEKDNE